MLILELSISPNRLTLFKIPCRISRGVCAFHERSLRGVHDDSVPRLDEGGDSYFGAPLQAALLVG